MSINSLSLVLRPLLDFMLQLWEKFSPQEWPGDEATILLQNTPKPHAPQGGSQGGSSDLSVQC